MSIDLYGRAKRALQKIRHSENEFRQVKRFELEFLPAGKRQHTLCKRCTAVRPLQRIVEKFGENLIVLRKTPLHELKAALDRHEKIIEVVCNAAGQLSDRLHLLRLQKGVAGFLQRKLRVLPLGDIARDFGKSKQRPIFIAYGVDDDIGPELRAVLTDAEPFFLKPTLARGGLKRDCRKPGLPVFFGIEP